jgi:hypothetical protein
MALESGDGAVAPSKDVEAGRKAAKYVKESGNSATRVSRVEISEVFFSALR